MSEKKITNKKDITGQKFNRLVALYDTGERARNRSVIWMCRCECGNEIAVAYSDLLYSNMRSCGCKKKEYAEKLPDMLTHVSGTSIDMLKSKKVPKNNTTGVKGVYLIRGKYVAKIVFQKKAYYLGTYEKFEDAVQARKIAEEGINGSVIAYYNNWKVKAEEDKEWAANNPIEIKVVKDEVNGLALKITPIIV